MVYIILGPELGSGGIDRLGNFHAIAMVATSRSAIGQASRAFRDTSGLIAAAIGVGVSSSVSLTSRSARDGAGCRARPLSTSYRSFLHRVPQSGLPCAEKGAVCAEMIGYRAGDCRSCAFHREKERPWHNEPLEIGHPNVRSFWGGLPRRRTEGQWGSPFNRPPTQPPTGAAEYAARLD